VVKKGERYHAARMRHAVTNDIEERLTPLGFCGQHPFIARNEASELADAANHSSKQNQMISAGWIEPSPEDFLKELSNHETVHHDSHKRREGIGAFVASLLGDDLQSAK
jgi:hypothetical protein